jgi:hypothetical protein
MPGKPGLQGLLFLAPKSFPLGARFRILPEKAAHARGGNIIECNRNAGNPGCDACCTPTRMLNVPHG